MMATRTVELRALWLEYRYWVWGLLAVLIIGSAVSNAWSAAHYRAENKRTIDAMNAAQDSVEMARHDAKVALERAAAWEKQADLRSAQANAALRDADKARQERDRLAHRVTPLVPGMQTTASDTVRARDAELSLANTEIDGLRVTVTEQSAALIAERSANVELRATVASQDSALKVAAKALGAGVSSLAHAQAPCRILFFSCPSRTVSAIGGGLVALITVVAVGR